MLILWVFIIVFVSFYWCWMVYNVVVFLMRVRVLMIIWECVGRKLGLILCVVIFGWIVRLFI